MILELSATSVSSEDYFQSRYSLTSKVSYRCCIYCKKSYIDPSLIRRNDDFHLIAKAYGQNRTCLYACKCWILMMSMVMKLCLKKLTLLHHFHYFAHLADAVWNKNFYTNVDTSVKVWWDSENLFRTSWPLHIASKMSLSYFAWISSYSSSNVEMQLFKWTNKLDVWHGLNPTEASAV